MAVFKVLKCPACGYNRTDSKPAVDGSLCLKCKAWTPKKVKHCPECKALTRDAGPPCLHDDRHPGMLPRMYYSEKWWVKAAGVKPYAVGPKKTDAIHEEARLVKNRIEGRGHLNRPNRTPWPVALGRFLEWSAASVSPKGHAMFKSCSNRLTESFEHLTIDKIRPDMVEVDYITRRRGEGVADSTINRELTTLKRMFVKCEEWGLIESDKIRLIKKLQEPDASERFYSESEVEAIRRECVPGSGRGKNKNLQTIVAVALNTGMRKGNCLALKLSDLDFPNRKIRVTIVKKKKDRRLTIPMTPDLYAALWSHCQGIDEPDPAGYLFPSPRNPGRPMRVDANFGFEAALKRAGVKGIWCPHCQILGGSHHPKEDLPACPDCGELMHWRREENFHTLRHTFATHFLSQMTTGENALGLDGVLRMLQEILAHSDLKTTQRYAHVVERHKDKAMDSFKL